jgi:hypothetical protein
MRDDLLHFTIEVVGKPIAVITHTDLEGARRLADENADEFAYLGAFEYGADLSVRLARGEERERWHAAVQAELKEGPQEGVIPPDEDRETYTVFLVPVSDPTDEYCRRGREHPVIVPGPGRKGHPTRFPPRRWRAWAPGRARRAGG